MGKVERKVSKKKVIRFILVILFLIALTISIICGIKYFKKEEKKENKPKVVEKIEKYGYSLDDNETEYYKTTYKQLKDVLNADVLDEKEYANIITKLFLADFFNLDNKIAKNDIGGVEFVYENFRNDFSLLAGNSIYHYVESNVYGDRTQSLPIVELVEIEESNISKVEYNDITDENGFIIKAKITYKEDLGYQTSATLYIVHTNDKLEIVKMD